MNVAIIPARGGSKRIPRKNIREFCGKPMIGWAIQAAIRSGCFEYVVVSTDDSEIGEVSRSFGAETPFKRPAELAGDHAATKPVVMHAVLASEAFYETTFDLVCCIYPSVPLLESRDIAAAARQLGATEHAHSIFSVAEYPHPIQRAFAKDSAGFMSRLSPEYGVVRTQDLESRYHDAGQFYVIKRDFLMQASALADACSLGYVLPGHRAVDIDNEDDWTSAELLFEARNLRLSRKLDSHKAE